MAKRKRKKQIKLIQTVIAIVIMLIAVIMYPNVQNEIRNEKNSISTAIPIEGELQMHVIDVGQGDSILFLHKDCVMLVDCGPKNKATYVIEYLKQLGISKIDILVGTHAHEDHMGGMSEMIRNFEIGTLYTPDHTKDMITTKWYMDFLDAVAEKGVNWEYPKLAQKFYLGSVMIQVVSEGVKEDTNLNNQSIGLRVSFGDTDIVLAGDAEEKAERQMLFSGLDLEAEIYKVAHHGSDTSTSEDFLEEINPQYAIISVGKDNSYGHPTKSVIQRLEKKKIEVHRTDEEGNIVLSTDGNNVTFH